MSSNAPLPQADEVSPKAEVEDELSSYFWLILVPEPHSWAQTDNFGFTLGISTCCHLYTIQMLIFHNIFVFIIVFSTLLIFPRQLTIGLGGIAPDLDSL